MEPIDLTDPEKLFDIVTEYEERIAALEAMVSSLRNNQHTEPEICPTCLGHGHVWSAFNEILYCRKCSGTGKLRAGR